MRFTLSVEEFFAVIRDSAWHSIAEIADRLRIPVSKLIELSSFLSERGILQYDAKTQRIRIESLWKLLRPEKGELP